MKIQATYRLRAYDPTWVKKMHKETELKYHGQQPPQSLEDEQMFKLAPSALAQRLKALYKDDFKAAMSALTSYRNRAGKTMNGTPDANRIEQAKEQLRKLYGKDDENKSSESNTGTQPSNTNGPTNVGKGNRSASGKGGKGREPIGTRPTGKII